MKLFQFVSGQILLGLLCFGLTGCKTQIASVGNGYEIVTHPNHSLNDGMAAPRNSFEFLDASGKTRLIWPDIYAASCVVGGEYAVFVGDKAYIEPDGKATHPRLFAVKAPELPMDITDEVLWRWSKATGKDFMKAENRFNMVTVTGNPDHLQVHLEFWSGGMLAEGEDWPDAGDVQLEWKQVAAILRTEKTLGVVQKDLRWHTPYIGMKF